MKPYESGRIGLTCICTSNLFSPRSAKNNGKEKTEQ